MYKTLKQEVLELIDEIAEYYHIKINEFINISKFHSYSKCLNYSSMLEEAKEILQEINDYAEYYDDHYPSEYEYDTEKEYEDAVYEFESENSDGSNYFDKFIGLSALVLYPKDEDHYEKLIIEQQAAVINYSLFNRDDYISEEVFDYA